MKKRKIMLVTMARPISSHVKDKNSIFTICEIRYDFLVEGKILVFHQYLYNKINYYKVTHIAQGYFAVGCCV